MPDLPAAQQDSIRLSSSEKCDAVSRDPWLELRRFTSARIALGRCGVSLPLDRWLDFRLAHARARDAVATPFAAEEIQAELAGSGLSSMILQSEVTGHEEYLTRPDKGRRLSAESRAILENWMTHAPEEDQQGFDVSLVVCDGLSARAVHENAAPFLKAFLAEAARVPLRCAPICLVRYGRVAVGDEIATLLRASLVVMLIGERPGLSAPNSMGVYMTWGPGPGTMDEKRNCISNVRAAGLPVEEAVRKLCYLMEKAFVHRASGVAVKDDMPADAIPFARLKALTRA